MSSGRESVRVRSRVLACLAAGLLAASAAGSEEAGTAPAGAGEIRGLLDAGRYAEAEAAARDLAGRLERASGPDSLPVAEALDLLVEALWRGAGADRPEARASAERAVRIKERLLGGEHAGVAASLHNLGNLLSRNQNPAEARQAFEGALRLREAALGPEHPDVAASLNGIGLAFWRMGEYARARPMLERAISILEKAHGPEHLNLGRSLQNLAILTHQMGDHAAARALHERSLAILEKQVGSEHPEVGGYLNNFGILLWEMGDLAGARARLERAIAIQEKSFGGSHPDLASSLNTLGTLVEIQGDYAEAEALHRHALEIQERILEPEHLAVAATLDGLGEVRRGQGDFAGARPYFERALRIKEARLGPQHPDVAQTLDELATLLVGLNETREAIRICERVVAIRKEKLGEENADFAFALAGLAEALAEAGEHARAEGLYERAVRILERSLGPDNPRLALVLGSMAQLYRRFGDPVRARTLYGRALGLLEKGYGPSNPSVASVLTRIGELEESAGDAAAARRALERALRIQEEVVRPEHPDIARALYALARVEWAEADPGGALERALRAEAIAREQFRSTARALSEREALRYEEVRTRGLYVSLSVLGAGGEPPAPGSVERVWDELVRSRALVLDEMAQRHRTVVGSPGPEVAAAARRLEMARNRLARLAVAARGAELPEADRAALDSARRETEEAERALAAVSAAFRAERARERAGIAEVARSLPAESALVAYVEYEQLPRPAGGASGVRAVPTAGQAAPSRAVRSYLALVLPPSGARPRVVRLGPADRIEARVRDWRERAGASPAGLDRAESRPERLAWEAGAALRRAIWTPIEAHLAGAKQIFVVPDGTLHLVNVAALSDGGGTYLVEGPRLFHYLSAERDLARSGEARPSGKGLLAIGGPDFDVRRDDVEAAVQAERPRPAVSAAAGGAYHRLAGAIDYRGPRAACAEFASLAFQPLAASAREVEEIESLWSGHASPPADVEPVLRLTGMRASEAAFKAAAAGRRILHLATHGFFLEGECGPGPRPADNPLLLSGLALAGANRRAEAGDGRAVEDGILTAEEIASLDLSGVEWAVLSACQTGVGEVRAGEGVLGLRRAFEIAGAGALIMSLWPVEDAAARDWMRELYRGRLGGLSTAEAVRQASVKVLEARRNGGRSTHPFYWGAFMASGDWR